MAWNIPWEHRVTMTLEKQKKYEDGHMRNGVDMIVWEEVI
jgi:hypothetical protein